jgi:FkbM family methyltransferase
MSMPKDFGGYSFRCDLRDAIAREVCFTGQYGPQETAVVKAILSAGMTFVDVGANWGYFTLLGANAVGGSGRVVSLEPHPVLFDVLQENVKRNSLAQVMTLKLAASNETGTVDLIGYDEASQNRGTSRLVSNRNGCLPIFQARAITLDDLFAKLCLETIDLLKMDIEGAEGFALQGLVKSLSQHRIHRLIVELHPEQLAEHGKIAEDVIELLMTLGYQGWAIDHSRRTTRRAAYSRGIDVRGLLRPFACSDRLDSWPHLLWAAKDMEPLP